jgi:uncharacterized RDD family membrane protein YckC
MTSARVRFAGVVTRATALAVDVALANIVVLVGAGVVRLFASLVGELRPERLADVLAAGAWSAAVALYFVWFWATVGQTPGMRLLGIRVLRSDGAPPSFPRALLRFAGLLLCIVPLFAGFLPVLFDRRRRGLHDMLARTEVVYGDAVQLAPPATAPSVRP